jgi:3-deoxy-D-arabino-heptulosonate 7-phosphate (DAHP) synthase class II
MYSKHTCPVVNPDREDGKVTLITRYGASKVNLYLI